MTGAGNAQLSAIITRVARCDAPVLVQGETGSGKELTVRAVHAASARRQGPFKAINCGALPAGLVETTLFGYERGAFTGADRPTAGLFEAAHGGTLFFDEIGELPLPAQAALLRVLETRTVNRVGSTREVPVDVRIVSATHRDLQRMVQVETFRGDLLHRIKVLVVDVPPLRERRAEIRALAESFLRDAAQRWGAEAQHFSEDAVRCLLRYGWPGNVRELRNVVERTALCTTGPTITSREFPVELHSGVRQSGAMLVARGPAISQAAPLAERVRNFEASEIELALIATQGNQRHAALLLGLPLRTLAYKLRLHGLRVSVPAAEPETAIRMRG